MQDAGLIFLSSMAGHVADFMLQSGNHNTKAIVSTALFVLSLYTALMGLVFIVIGRMRLASVIQYLPMPGTSHTHTHTPKLSLAYHHTTSSSPSSHPPTATHCHPFYYRRFSVVGGYLAFIGFYCGQAGLAMMSGVDLQSITDWPQLLTYRALVLLGPGLCYGVTIYVLLISMRSAFTLPMCMGGLLVCFYR